MTDLTDATRANVATRPDRMRVARLIVGYGAIVFMLPYLALKIAWLSGNPTGFNDARLVNEPGMIAVNVISFGMDFVAVGLALTLTHRWGLRVPGWLVLFPMWVATGFLAPAVVIAPIAIITQALAADPVPSTNAMLQPWVGRVVTASFAGQGAALIVAFVLYVRTRWANLLQQSTTAAAGATHPVQLLLANVAVVMAVAAGGLHLVWAFGGTAGLSHRAVSERTAQWYLLNGIWGSMSIAGAAGILTMVHQWSRRAPFILPLTLSWIGAGSMFAWGLWTLILVLPGITFGRRSADGMALFNCLSFVKFTAGMLIGLITVVLLAERQAAIRQPAP